MRLGPNIYSGLRPAGDGYIDMWTVGKMLPRLAQASARDPTRPWTIPQTYQTPCRTWRPGSSTGSLSHTKQELWFKAQEQRIPSGPLNYIDEVVADPQFRATGFWNKVDRSHTGLIEYPGSPFAPYIAPRQLRRPAPTLGQHNQEVFCGLLGFSKPELSRVAQMGIV